MKRCVIDLGCFVVAVAVVFIFSGCAISGANIVSSSPVKGGKIVIQTGAANNEDPVAAGKDAAALLKKAMNGTSPDIVIMFDSYDELSLKKKAIAGVGVSLFKGHYLWRCQLWRIHAGRFSG